MKVSIVIPYYRRYDNIRLVFSALARQTISTDDFEVVVGAMEFDSQFIALCEEFASSMTIVSVFCSKPWCVSAARNQALRQARGEVVVLLDADMLLPNYFIKHLWDQHFSNNESHCVIGQMIDYDNNEEDVLRVDVHPFSDYEAMLQHLESEPMQEHDMRWKNQCNIPFAYIWTALVALPRSLILEHALFFDEHYKGYGVEDLEWGYRVSRTNTSIELKSDVWGLHLSHARNTEVNALSEKINYSLFLKQVPEKAVELMGFYGDYEANKQYNEILKDIQRVLPSNCSDIGVAQVIVQGCQSICFGVELDAQGEPINLELIVKTKHYEVEHCWPIIGLKVPVEDATMISSYIGDVVYRMPPKYIEAIAVEAQRVSVCQETKRFA